ncbi:MAG: BrnT family toxin [bacterium]
MNKIRFEWDTAKAALNLEKHKVSFEEAEGVFYDERALLIADPDHSENEDRFVLLGMSLALRLLVVCHCERAGGLVLRIISARKADRRETKRYRRKRP